RAKSDTVTPLTRHKGLTTLSGVGHGGRPFAHGLITGAVHVHLVIDRGHPAHRDEVVHPAVVLGQLDGSLPFDVIDGGELLVLGTDDGHVGLDCVRVHHCFVS